MASNLSVGVLVIPTTSAHERGIYGRISACADDGAEPRWIVDWPDRSEWEFSDDITEACECARPIGQCPTYPCRVVS